MSESHQLLRRLEAHRRAIMGLPAPNHLLIKDEDLSDIELTHTAISHVTFENCILTQAVFDHITLQHVTFSNCTMHRARFAQALLSDVTLQNVEGESMYFRDTNARDMKWLSADTPELSLFNCTFHSNTWLVNNMRHSVMSYTTFTDTTLRDIDWAGIHAPHLTLIETTVTRVKFTGAQISDALIKDSVFKHAALEDAYMTNIEIIGTPSIPAISATLYSYGKPFPLTYFPGIDLCVSLEGPHTLEDTFALLRTRISPRDRFQDNMLMQLALIEAQWRNIDFELLDYEESDVFEDDLE